MTLALKLADARYDGYDEGLEKGISIGLEQGLERGAHQKALETARAMIGLGIPVDQVQLCTNLPLDVIQGLLESSET